MELLVNNNYIAKEFYYETINGGGGMVKPPKPIEVKVIKAWDDYETGWRSWAKPKITPELVEYFKSIKCKNPDDPILYVGEFDVDRKATADLWIKSKKFKL